MLTDRTSDSGCNGKGTPADHSSSCIRTSTEIMPVSSKTILIVEDDSLVVMSIEEALGAEGFTLRRSRNGQEAFDLIKQGGIDLVIVDIGLPDVSGFDILKSFDKDRPFGVIVVTARCDVVDIVLGLELGADDYVVKPFEPREFLARVRNVMRRYSLVRGHAHEPPPPLVFGLWTFDPSTRMVKRGGEKAVKLTAIENRLLRIFIENPNQILTRDRILDLLHPTASEIPFDRSIDVTVTRLRRKIELNARRPQYIKTAHGDGYLFNPQGD